MSNFRWSERLHQLNPTPQQAWLPWPQNVQELPVRINTDAISYHSSNVLIEITFTAFVASGKVCSSTNEHSHPPELAALLQPTAVSIHGTVQARGSSILFDAAAAHQSDVCKPTAATTTSDSKTIEFFSHAFSVTSSRLLCQAFSLEWQACKW